MIGLDTNVLIRYLAQDDPAQTAVATELIEHRLATEGPGFVNLVTILETLWVLRRIYALGSKEIVAVVESLLQIETLEVQNEQQVFEAAAVLKRGLGSFEDALISTLNLASGCTSTLTFDRKASRLPGFTLL